jgi:high affinity choline transporter 7
MEILWVMRVGIFVVGVLATVMGITIKSVYGLWFLCADLVYVVLFPQLVCVVYAKDTNTYGSLVAYIIGLLLRLSGGEKLVGLPPLIKFPYYDPVDNVQLFPFRTLSMAISFVTIICVSYLTKYIFESDCVSKRFDWFHCYSSLPIESIALKESATADELSKINVETVSNRRYDEAHDRPVETSFNSVQNVFVAEKSHVHVNKIINHKQPDKLQ